MNNSIINFSTWNTTDLTISKSCFSSNGYNTECILKNICPQLTDYYIRIGILLIIAWVVIGWFLWWFLNYGYKYLPNKKIDFFGNFHNLDTRIYWDNFIRTRLQTAFVIYTCVVVYLNIK